MTASGVAPAGASPLPPNGRLKPTAVLSVASTDTQRQLGTATAMSQDGRTVVVAAERPDFEQPTNVYVFARTSDGWSRQAILTSTPGRDALIPESVAISADGDLIAVGDPRTTGLDGTDAAGSVDLYQRTGTRWSWQNRLRPAAPVDFGTFGVSVALSGDGHRLAVASGSGASVYSATETGGWAPAQHLTLPTPLAYAWGDIALSADGRTAIISAYAGEDGVALFTADAAGVWRFGHMFSPRPDLLRGNLFGWSLAISADGGTVVIGDPTDDAIAGYNPGHHPPSTTVFNRSPTGWTRTATFLGHGSARAGALGFAVAVSADGDTVLSTDPYRAATHGTQLFAGGGYRFQRDSTGWHYGGALYPAFPHSYAEAGASVALSGDGRTAVLGAPGSLYYHRAGNAYLFTG